MATTANPTRHQAPARRSRSVAAQVKYQRRGYARAVLRSLARSQRGQPVAQVTRVLRSALTPLGVRLSPAVLRDLATGIAVGNPVELPDPTPPGSVTAPPVRSGRAPRGRGHHRRACPRRWGCRTDLSPASPGRAT